MDKQKKIFGKLKILPDSAGLSIAILAGLLGEALFLLFVLALDVLPFKYVLLILIALFVIDSPSPVPPISRERDLSTR